jgi:hypothetical protein
LFRRVLGQISANFAGGLCYASRHLAMKTTSIGKSCLFLSAVFMACNSHTSGGPNLGRVDACGDSACVVDAGADLEREAGDPDAASPPDLSTQDVLAQPDEANQPDVASSEASEQVDQQTSEASGAADDGGADGAAPADSGADAVVAAPVPTLRWAFEEDMTATVVSDSSPSGLGGTYVNTQVSTDVPPLAVLPNTRSRSFSAVTPGAAEIAVLPEALKLTPVLSIALWYQASTLKSPNDGVDLLSLGDNQIVRLHATGVAVFKRAHTAGEPSAHWSGCLGQPGVPHLDGRWHHVTAVYDVAATHIYFDGVELQTDGDCASADPIEYDQPGAFRVGRHGAPTPNPTYDFAGSLDDARVYARALTAAEVKALAGGAF